MSTDLSLVAGQIADEAVRRVIDGEAASLYHIIRESALAVLIEVNSRPWDREWDR